MTSLASLRVVEFDAIGPVPFAAMMLADRGAHVTRILRPGGQPNGVDAGARDTLLRGRARTVALDLKSDSGRADALDFLAGAEVSLEGFRPGVMERLGLAPEAVHAVRPDLVYVRVTGWGQTGQWSRAPGHDINYMAAAGLLSLQGSPDHPPQPPVPPMADFGGGGMMAAFEAVAGVISARATGRGGVIDVAMVDGARTLATLLDGWRTAGLWTDGREANLLDGGAPFYRTYETACGGHLALGAIELRFRRELCAALELDATDAAGMADQTTWPKWRRRIARLIRARTLHEWTDIAARHPDACMTPVAPFGARAPRPAAR